MYMPQEKQYNSWGKVTILLQDEKEIRMKKYYLDTRQNCVSNNDISIQNSVPWYGALTSYNFI